MMTYYLVTFIIFILLSLNCFGFVGRWSTDTCLVHDALKQMVVDLKAEQAAMDAAEANKIDTAEEDTPPASDDPEPPLPPNDDKKTDDVKDDAKDQANDGGRRLGFLQNEKETVADRFRRRGL